MTASSAIVKRAAGATNAMAAPPRPRMTLATSILAVLAVIGSRPGHADSILTLKSDFIEKYKNNVTIDADFLVDKAPPHEHSAAEDGDMHVAGRADQIGLPTVA